MIYSVLQHKKVPVSVTKEEHYIDDEFGSMIRYTVCDASKKRINVGYVDLQDTKNGVNVLFIKNQNPNLYKHFGQVADQIELEHCLKKGINRPYISSTAAIGTHIIHFLRGKRFIDEGVNIYLDYLTKNLKKGEHVLTGFFGYQKLYMPFGMINEIKDKIKISPLLKGIK